MRLGVQISAHEGVPWDRWRRLATTVEDLGFHSLYRSDHYFSYSGDRRQDALETWTTLAVAALETSRIRLGTLVCPVTFRHPALLARMAAQVDTLSGGRLELGLGAGHYVGEHEAFGIPFPEIGARMDMLEETCQVLRALWGPGPADFCGRHYRLEGAACYPKPVQPRLPIMIGGRGERRTLRIAAEHADHWNILGADLDGFAAKRGVLERHCAALERDPREVRCSLEVGMITGRDLDEMRRHTVRAGAVNPGLARDPDAAMAQLRERGWLVGPPDGVVSELARLGEAGVDELIVQHKDSDNWALLESVGERVLPHV